MPSTNQRFSSHLDLTQIAEENITVLAKWICDYTKNETEADIPQALKIAEHYRDNFEEAQELVCAAHEAKKHLRIPQSDPELGKVVSNIRSRKSFLHHADFAMWLWCACFEMHTKDLQLNRERWTQVFASEGGVI